MHTIHPSLDDIQEKFWLWLLVKDFFLQNVLVHGEETLSKGKGCKCKEKMVPRERQCYEEFWGVLSPSSTIALISNQTENEHAFQHYTTTQKFVLISCKLSIKMFFTLWGCRLHGYMGCGKTWTERLWQTCRETPEECWVLRTTLRCNISHPILPVDFMGPHCAEFCGYFQPQKTYCCTEGSLQSSNKQLELRV